MGSYFLDTSAIVKCYFPEQGHFWVANLCDPAQKHDLFISQAALVEVIAAICRKAREQNMQIVRRDRTIDMFRADCANIYNRELVTESIYANAGNLCRTYRLRAYDAVQLACALSRRREALANRMALPIFVCADKKLAEFASAEGLATDNPEHYQ